MSTATATTSFMIRGLLVVAPVLVAACGGGGSTEAGPQLGTAAWHWEAAQEELEAGKFTRAVEEMTDVAGRDDPLAEKAVLWRTSTLAGLALGHLEAIDNFNSAISEDSSLEETFGIMVQQLERDGRQYAIELAESLGEVDKAMTGDSITLDFPFPGGAAGESPAMVALAGGEAPPDSQIPAAIEHTIRRGLIRAASELAGMDVDSGNAAKAKYEAGPVPVPTSEARRTMAKLLLDVSLLFSRERINDSKIRTIFIDRAEQWAKPFAESEDEAEKEWAEGFAEEIEDERRDMDRKARRKRVRS